MTDRSHIAPLRDFIAAFTANVDAGGGEAALLERGRAILARLVAQDDWLPEAYAQPHPEHYQQYLLHLDPARRYSLVSFVWGPGQRTPIHNHTVWGLIGMLRGAERAEAFVRGADGALASSGAPRLLSPGDVDAVSPAIGDIHQVSNAYDDQVSISVHVYGADIGAVRRSVFKEDGRAVPFISGYAQPGGA
jgi:predicted metal-dependent enzyme (double-stranded beta helix superfamily)